jgi:hypothetical protein
VTPPPPVHAEGKGEEDEEDEEDGEDEGGMGMRMRTKGGENGGGEAGRANGAERVMVGMGGGTWGDVGPAG